MKIWTNEHVFNYSWETVANSQWRKYPNPHNTAVLGTDVLDRFVSSDGKLISKRIITSDWGLAPWVQTLIGANRYFFSNIEEQTALKFVKTETEGFVYFLQRKW